jgi:hypothetical protein
VPSREGIITAARARTTPHGRRRRPLIAALGITLVALTVGCSDDDDPSKAQDQNVFGIATSAENPVCLQVTDALPPEVKELPIIGCDQPHTHEVYATVTSGESVYPGVDALGQFAQVKCLDAFQAFVGISAFDSALTYSWLVPSLESWNDKDDRDILCVLSRRDRSDLVGSMRDSQV